MSKSIWKMFIKEITSCDYKLLYSQHEVLTKKIYPKK